MAGRKPTLSPTRIRAYLECAMKYRYIYVDKIGRFYLRAHAGYSFGSTLHHVLQQFHDQGAGETAEAMVSRIDQNWIAVGYETVEQQQEHREAGVRMIQEYHSAHRQRIADEIETLAVEKTISCDMGRFKLSGRVDRIDRHSDGRLEVIDYKSGRTETSSDEVLDSLAMSCYQLILRKMYPGVPVFATIYSLRTGHQASAELTGERLGEFERDILVLGAEILDRDYSGVEPVPVPACKECDFLPRCEAFWRQQEREALWGNMDSPHSEHGL